MNTRSAFILIYPGASARTPQSYAARVLITITMKNTLVQNRYISIPATTGTNVYQTIFKSDDLFKFLSGIACTIAGSAPTADEIKIELRDDFKSILSFSPYPNWLRSTASQSYDLTDVFKPLNVESAGKQFYLNVKVTNCSAFSFTALFRQENKGSEVVTYDIQSFDITAPTLGQNVSITLPSDYSKCKGINVTGGNTANAAAIALDVNDSTGNIIDPIPFNVLTATVNTQNNSLFFDCDFDSASKQINVRLTALDSSISYTATNYTISFLLVK